MPVINSQEYWNTRFNTDWIMKLGRLQSAFFATQAITHFPAWLTNLIVKDKLSICDWGCALGDGTNELAQAFPANHITGIDFSEVAIKDALRTYPGIEFKSENFLETASTSKYDIFFTSNVLEHFSNPWETLLALCTFAEKHIVVLIPYKELERHSEHEFTFTEKNIPKELGADFLLTHFKIADTGKCEPNYWGGLQAFLIFSHKDHLDNGQLEGLSEEEITEVDRIFFEQSVQTLATGAN